MSKTVNVLRAGAAAPAVLAAAGLVADRAYDSRGLRANLGALGYGPCVLERKGQKPQLGPKPPRDSYRSRCHLAQAIAWCGNNRRFLMRHEHYAHVVMAFVLLICILT